MAPVSAPRTTSPVMVGRAHELDVLAEFGRGLRSDAPAVALVGGSAGLGKSRLVAEATRRWQDQRCRVLLGQCAPVVGAPYTPLVSALRRAVPSNAPVLRMLMAARATSRAELFEALRTAVDGLAARDPLILVAEDLHWSDHASRDALAYLVSQSSGGRFGIVGTHRYDGAVTAREFGSFVDAMARRGPVTRIALEPLAVTQVANVAAAITGVRPPEADAEVLHRRTGGIPLLVEEVLALGGGGVPDHLRTIFVTRVLEQGDDVAQVLEVVAVADQCDELVIAGVLGMDVPTVALALKRARDADLVLFDAIGYRFRHDLLKEAVYDEIPPGRRRELHRLVAARLAARGDVEPAIVAEHWHRAGEREQTALSSLTAAEQAEQVHAPAAAHKHYERILSTWHRLGDPVLRQIGPRDELLRRAAYAAERSGDFARAVDLTAERITRGVGTANDQAQRWERLARYRWEAGDGHGSHAAYQEAARVLPIDAPPTVRATVLSGLAWHLAATFQYEEAKQLAAEALAACADVDDQAVLWQAYLARGIAWLGSTTGHHALDESCRLATAVGVGDRVAITRMWLNFSNQRLGYTADREPNLRIALRAAAADGLGLSMEAALRYMLAEYLCETGRWDEARYELELNLDRLRVAGIPALFSWGYQSRLAAWRGDFPEAVEALERTRALTELAPQQPLPLACAFAGRAGLLLWEGRLDEAVESAREALTLGSVSGYDAAEPLAILCRAEADVAEWTTRSGNNPDPGVYAELSGRLIDLGREPAPRARAFAAMCAAELDRWSGLRTAAPWRRAVEAWQEVGDPYQEACARWRLGWALLANRSGRAEAASHLTSAADTASALGARPLGLAVRRLSVRARLQVRSPGAHEADPSFASSLTARELEVLPLLVAGRSNAEIAEILVISPRTVGIHVSRILHKLGAERRAQVSDLARRAGPPRQLTGFSGSRSHDRCFGRGASVASSSGNHAAKELLMSSPFIVISKSRIKSDKAEAYAAWCDDMFADVEEQEPRLLAFNQWESEDHTFSVVIQVHPDAESFEYHLKLFGERVKETFDQIDVQAVEIYGPASPFVEQFVSHGLEGLPMTLYPQHTGGFTRLTPA
ncbi:helix-turn-helix transcriptional regulator [Kribbella turkmenica]|nr:LuxR family transcriptional regulator [Kribbella turkmenica]